MLGFGALGELPLADFGTPEPGTYISLPSVQIDGVLAIVGFRGGRNLQLVGAPLALTFATIGVEPGKSIGLPNVAFAVSARPAALLAGKSFGLPAVAMGFAYGPVEIQTGRIFNLASTITIATDIGALAEGALGEFATGEGAALSIEYTRPVRLRLDAMASGVQVGKNFDLPPPGVLFGAYAIEVDARPRSIRINAIAS